MNSLVRSAVTAAAVCLAALATSSCAGGLDLSFSDQITGSGNVTTETYDLGDFDEIDVCCGLDVLFEIDPEGETSVSISADDNIHEYLRIEVVDDALTVTPKNNVNLNFKSQIVVSVSGYEITEVELRDGTYATGTFPSVDQFTLKVRDGSDSDITVDAEKFVVEAADGSDLDLEGRAGFVDVKASDGSDVRMSSVEANDVKVEATDGSVVEVRATNLVEGKATDGSDIGVWGDPSTLDVETDDSSDVDRN